MTFRPLQRLSVTSSPTTFPTLVLLMLTACQTSGSGARTPSPADRGDPAGIDGSNAAVIDWSAAAYQSFVAAEKYANPLRVVRVLAMLHLAQHDALAAIRPMYAPWGLTETAPQADPVAAAASSAFEVLVAELPGQRAALASLLERSLQSSTDASARDAGVVLGQRAARAVLQRRQGDGSDAPVLVPLSDPGRPGAYRPVPPDDFVFQPGWRSLRPFALQAAEQFRVAPPPELTSVAYAEAFDEVRRLGAKDSSTRSLDQTALANFWYEFSDIGWNRIARTVASERKLGLQATARLFALLNVAMSDAYVAGWDSKFHYDLWRPFSAIRGAEGDGNDRTAADPAWQPELKTPPVPDYPSTHSALGDAGAEVLAHVFGDDVPFAFTSTTAMTEGALRSFKSFSQAADENAESRVTGGLHFRFACKAGQALGRQVGAWVVATALRPVAPADVAQVSTMSRR